MAFAVTQEDLNTQATPEQTRQAEIIAQNINVHPHGLGQYASVDTQMYEALGFCFVLYVMPVLLVLWFINKALNIWASKRKA